MDKRKMIHQDQIDDCLLILQGIYENSSPEFFKEKGYKDQPSINDLTKQVTSSSILIQFMTRALERMGMIITGKNPHFGKQIGYKWNPEKCTPNEKLAKSVIEMVRKISNDYKIERKKKLAQSKFKGKTLFDSTRGIINQELLETEEQIGIDKKDTEILPEPIQEEVSSIILDAYKHQLNSYKEKVESLTKENFEQKNLINEYQKQAKVILEDIKNRDKRMEILNNQIKEVEKSISKSISDYSDTSLINELKFRGWKVGFFKLYKKMKF